MSVSTEVQRTLVKSPPELWSELSSAEGLTRHLGEVGEIRVTKVEPESRVEWEADQASGVVEIEPSGWGTKVTLSLTRAPLVPEPACSPMGEPAAAELEPQAGPEPESESRAESESKAEPEPEPTAEELAAPQPAIVAPEPEPACPRTGEPAAAEPVNIVEVRPEPEPKPDIEPEPIAGPQPIAATPPSPERKRGFFARLFKRKPRPPVAEQPAPTPEPEIEALAQPEPVYPPAAPEPIEQPEPAEPPVAVEPPGHGEPTAEPVAAAATEPGIELAELEAEMQQQTTELLTGVLDRLGAAHHRPFSRG